MRRAWLVIATATMVIVAGCGKKSYEDRLTATLGKLDYDRRLKKNLMEPPTEKKFIDLTLYIRAPKEEVLAKTGQLPVAEGSFDLDASFNDPKDNSSLHVLARVKMPKKPPSKGAAPVAAPPPRAEFLSEIFGVLNNAFNNPEVLQQVPKFSDEARKGGNRFKRLIFPAGDKEVKLYTYKQGAHEVALVFVYDPKNKALMAQRIEYCLDSFATGERAARLYSGGTTEEEDAGPPIPL